MGGIENANNLEVILLSHWAELIVFPHPVRVVCVDDNRDIADSEAMLLRLYGYNAVACYDGEQALQTIREFRPEACLFDINMPGMSRLQLAREVRIEHSEPPPTLVAVTATGGEDDFQRSAEAGFDAHLVKPVRIAEIVDILSKIEPSGEEAPC